MLPQVAIWPSLATTAGMGFTLIARGIYLVCHPCHCFEEKILNSDAKRISTLCGKGGNPPVHGVLGKLDFPTPSDPFIKVLADV